MIRNRCHCFARLIRHALILMPGWTLLSPPRGFDWHLQGVALPMLSVDLLRVFSCPGRDDSPRPQRPVRA